MSEAGYTFHAGQTPLLISIPHDGRVLPVDIELRMTAAGKALPDTDWHVAQLYRFATDIGASVITAGLSRYVIDLNRPAADSPLYAGQVSTGLCPAKTFAGESIYLNDATVDEDERNVRVARYWRPYHDRIGETLALLKDAHGYALLWDAHSIISEVPALFDGELPVLNLGTYQGRSCDQGIEDALAEVARQSPYSAVCNGRFTGGFITRHYGAPDEHVHAVQLELAQRSYMDEKTLRYDASRSAALIETLRELLLTFMRSAQSLYG